jgi:cell pole-organizing protein PopZ
MMAPVIEEEDEDVLELTQPADEEPAPIPLPPLPEPEPVRAAPRRQPSYDDDDLMSAGPSNAASNAFSGLANYRRGGPSLAGPGPIGNGDATLEQIVYAVVRPLIREWLDDNLPQMVEKMVKREIEKVVRRGLD